VLIEGNIHGLRLERHPHNAMLRQMVRSHHESLDGSGYLDGLRGEAIHPKARIVAVADIYDALIGSRCVAVLLAAQRERLTIASAQTAP